MFVLFFALCSLMSFANDHGPRRITKEFNTTPFTTMIVSGDVTVMLIESTLPDQALKVEGEEAWMKYLDIKQSGDTLRIDTHRKNLKNRLVIYVPANYLSAIHVNSSAHISSLNVLRSPKIDVLINGACEFHIKSVGLVNIIEGDRFDVEIAEKKIRLPSGALVDYY